MKAIYKSLIAAAAMVPMLSSCIEETFPTSGMTEEQLGSSATATEALVWGMSAYMNHVGTISSDRHWDWGYGSFMHIRDVMTEDVAIISTGYDWYQSWEMDQNQGSGFIYPQFFWNLYYQLILTTNNTIGAINPEEANDQQLCYLGMGYAYRASHYLEMAQCYEFLPNTWTSNINLNGNDISGLTVPIVTEDTDEETARDNPRATHDEMFNFILGDLTKAEEYIQKGVRTSKTQPDLAVVYGIYARLYLWEAGVQDTYGDAAGAAASYTKAGEYARLAINNHAGSPLTKEEWLSTTSGFNDISSSSWMWGSDMVKEDDAVQTGILNWTSWNSNEAQFGYAAAGANMMINAATYDRISNSDFRKLSFIAPEGTALYGQEPMIDEEWDRENLATYSSLKFRPAEGNVEDYTVGAASAYPLMRVEEMYLIEAEAAAHTNPAQGVSLINSFMQNYRYKSYNCTATDKDGVVEEIIFQKRVELWGEGRSFFDIKRLDYSVTRSYDGTNFYPNAALNTDGRPAWMNFCIVQTEQNNNSALIGWNNPDPSIGD